MENGVIALKDPWLIVCDDKSKGQFVTTVTQPPGSSYQSYGLLIADCIRHENIGDQLVDDYVVATDLEGRI